MQMAQVGMITDMLLSFPSKLPKCDHCILGKKAIQDIGTKGEGGGRRAQSNEETEEDLGQSDRSSSSDIQDW